MEVSGGMPEIEARLIFIAAAQGNAFGYRQPCKSVSNRNKRSDVKMLQLGMSPAGSKQIRS